MVGVGLAVVAGFGVLRTPAMGSTLAEVSGRFGAPLNVAADYELLRMRDSGEFDLRVELPATPAAIKLRVLPDEEEAASYRVTLSRDVEGGGAKIVASAEKLAPDELRYVTLFVSAEKLAPGAYSLMVEPEGSNARQEQPAFRIEVSAK